eukprot:scaffold274353_cov30-Tisochrysis_lutea.AAC.6
MDATSTDMANPACHTKEMPKRSARASLRSYRSATTRSSPNEATVRIEESASDAMAPAAAERNEDGNGARDARDGRGSKDDQADVPAEVESESIGEEQRIARLEHHHRFEGNTVLDRENRLAEARRELLRVGRVKPAHVLPEDGAQVTLLVLGDLARFGHVGERGVHRSAHNIHQAHHDHHLGLLE